MSTGEILEEVEKDRLFYKHSGGGVTFSGGEPLLQPDFNQELFRACKSSGINVGVSTCGHVPWTNIEQVMSYVDFFLWDIKHMHPQKHQEYTGASNELLLNNIRLVSENGIPLYIRLPVIPGYNDSEANVRATCEFAKDLRSVARFDLVPVHHLGRARYESLNCPYPIDNVSLIPGEVMRDLKHLVESYGLECCIGG